LAVLEFIATFCVSLYELTWPPNCRKLCKILISNGKVRQAWTNWALLPEHLQYSVMYILQVWQRRKRVRH